MKPLSLRPRAVRTLVLFSVIAGVLILYMARLVQVQVFQYEEWSRRSIRNHQSKRVLEMRRGAIIDRNGLELAISVETSSVFLFTREVRNMEETINLLATVLPMTRDQIAQKVGNRRGYLPLIRNLDRNLAQNVRALNLPGVVLEANYRRFYPQNTLAANLLGFCGTEGHGLEGIELRFDKTLRGEAGIAVQEDVSFGDEGPARMRIVQPPMGGSTVVLTIDAFIQHILETELARLVASFTPIDATAIAMDPMTGEILGMAGLPTFDLNRFAESSPDSRRNRPVVDIHEPGSSMKIFPLAIALQGGRISGDTRFYCRGYGQMPGRRIRCPRRHGLVDVDMSFAESCNAAMVQIAQMIDAQDLYRIYRNLGFGELTGIEMPGESAGTLLPPSRWSGFSLASLCIGQEIAVTGLQLVRAYAAIANGGWLLQPRIVQEIRSHHGDIQERFSPRFIRRVFPPALAHRLRRLLAIAVENGTGRLAALPEYSVGGKTSTAQKANPRGGYFMDKVVVSFIGIAPVHEPRVVLYVSVNEPKGDERTLYGGKIAAPAFAAMLDRILKHLNVPPDRKPMAARPPGGLPRMAATATRAVSFLDLADTSGPQALARPPQGGYAARTRPTSGPAVDAKSEGAVLPDVRGLPLREVVRIFSRLDLPVQYEGHGLAFAQTPPPGTPLTPGTQIVVRFSPRPVAP